MRDQAKVRLFEYDNIITAVLKLAIPTVISQIILVIYNMADTYFIGMTGSNVKITAVTVCMPAFMFLSAISNLFGVGGAAVISRALGAKEHDKARHASSFAFWGCVALTIFYSLLALAGMDWFVDVLGGAHPDVHAQARGYLTVTVVIGGLATSLNALLGHLVRSEGRSLQAGFGIAFGGALNIALDPLFMFLILPDGLQVMGAGLATMLSNVATLLYFTLTYRRVSANSVLSIPRRLEPIRAESRRNIFGIGIPAALSVFLFDLTNIVINRLSASHGDIELAAIGIVQKVERFPLNIGIGICLAMIPLIGYNYAAGNHRRMDDFFTAARVAGLAVAAVSVVMYYAFAPQLIGAFIADARTVQLGTAFLRARCFATPFMFLSFNMVNFMQAVNRGRESFWLAAIRQIGLNIPLLFLMNALFGMMGIVWTQAVADILNVVISYVIYGRVMREIRAEPPGRTA